MRKREITIPTLLGTLVALLGLGSGLWLLREPLRNWVGATGEEVPQEVKITNVTDSSVTVSWVTPRATSGFIQYGPSNSASVDLVVSDDRDQEGGTVSNYFTHLVTIPGLSPNSSYVFRIGSGRRLYDQQGQLYRVTTGLTLRNPPPADVAYGQVVTGSGDPAEGAIVYLSLPGAVPQAALVKPSGSWVIPLSTVRSADLTNFTAYDKQNTQMDIFVQGGPLGTARITAQTGADSPLATITLNQTSAPAEAVLPESQSPGESAVSFDITPSGESKFSQEELSPATVATAAGELVLLTPQAGERINTSRPEIIGRAPRNARVTITIESPQTYVDTVRADAAGEFSYSAPEDLPPGRHRVTVSVAVGKVVKKITKDFVVLAAGESSAPAYTASPAASLQPKPQPTPTPVARISLPSTAGGVPTSGNLTPTLVMLLVGMLLTAGGLAVYKKG